MHEFPSIYVTCIFHVFSPPLLFQVPTILVSGGPMLNGKYKGRDIGSGTDVWSMSEAVRAGTMSSAEFFEAESCMRCVS